MAVGVGVGVPGVGVGVGPTSQASPRPSPSLSVWSALASRGQLSLSSVMVSLSSSSSQTLPCPSPSASSWSVLAICRQLSYVSGAPSPSVSDGHVPADTVMSASNLESTVMVPGCPPGRYSNSDSRCRLSELVPSLTACIVSLASTPEPLSWALSSSVTSAAPSS